CPAIAGRPPTRTARRRRPTAGVPTASTSFPRCGSERGAAPPAWTADLGDPGRAAGAASERGERPVELVGGGRALVEAGEPEGLVGRVVGVVLEAEARHHRGDVAGGELGHYGDRAA